MFNKKTDPLASSVQKVMRENALRRQLEQKLNEELGVASKKALPHELHDDYDAALKSSLQEADTRDHAAGITHEPPTETGFSGKNTGFDTRGLNKMFNTSPENGGIKDDIKEGILKNALAKMGSKKKKVVDAEDADSHIKAQKETDLRIPARNKKKK